MQDTPVARTSGNVDLVRLCGQARLTLRPVEVQSPLRAWLLVGKHQRTLWLNSNVSVDLALWLVSRAVESCADPSPHGWCYPAPDTCQPTHLRLVK